MGRAVQIKCSIDRCDEDAVDGWIFDPDQPGTRFSLDVLLAGRMIGGCRADQFRPDLKDAGLGNGDCAFSFTMPADFSVRDLSLIRLRVAGTDLLLPSPAQPTNATVSPSVQASGRSTSRFGNLWIDRADWIDVLGRKHRAGEMSDDMAETVCRFVRDGYVILPGMLDHTEIESARQALDRLWDQPPPSALMESFEPDGQWRCLPPDARWRYGRTALIDPYAHSSALRQVLTRPACVAFLATILDDTPCIFNARSRTVALPTEMHKDTARQAIAGNPLALLTMCLALDEIGVKNGGLQFFVGSHRAPDFLFGGVSKSMDSHIQDYDSYVRSIHADAERFEHRRSIFEARPGDLLIHHADLAHAVSAPTDGTQRRRTLTAHVTGARHDPPYSRPIFQKLEADGCQFVSRHSDIVVHERLPVVRPELNSTHPTHSTLARSQRTSIMSSRRSKATRSNLRQNHTQFGSTSPE